MIVPLLPQFELVDDIEDTANPLGVISDTDWVSLHKPASLTVTVNVPEGKLSNVYELPKGRKDLYGVSCKLGSGTEWCTATGKTKSYFNKYISSGPLFIFIKPGSEEKYQFSYENDQFMDKDDTPII